MPRVTDGVVARIRRGYGGGTRGENRILGSGFTGSSTASSSGRKARAAYFTAAVRGRSAQEQRSGAASRVARSEPHPGHRAG
jgi:hypothetical protein